MSEIAFGVLNWMAWSPGLETRAAWRAWATRESGQSDAGFVSIGSGDQVPNELPALPMLLRRRAGQFGRTAISTALACGDAERARFVFSSRHSDLTGTAKILAMLAVDEPPSPAEFSMSVHHALAGLLSIHTGNRQGHTAIAAGPDSFGFGFLEGVLSALDALDAPTLMLYCDAPPPAEFCELRVDHPDPLPIALAVSFAPASSPKAFRFSAAPIDGSEPPFTEPPSLAFLRFLLTDLPSVASNGERMSCHWSRAALPC